MIAICNELLGPIDIWQKSKYLIDPSVTVFIDTKGARTAEAHFDILGSTPERIVIQMNQYPTSQRDKGSLAHELVHAIQWLTNQEGDLMFITDATRDIRSFSKSGLWERLMYAIYLSCPQETEAWQAGNLYHRHSILNEMIPWMKSFNPEEAAKELEVTNLEPNKWEMDSFTQLPEFWAEAYLGYDEIKDDSYIPQMSDFTLEEFLSHYNNLFKTACEKLEK